MYAQNLIWSGKKQKTKLYAIASLARPRTSLGDRHPLLLHRFAFCFVCMILKFPLRAHGSKNKRRKQ
ncbi:hypothetical protein CR513_58967, partial [Mucuna pruriens]